MSTNSLMRESDVRYIVLHCSATRCNTDYTEEMLLRDHLARKFKANSLKWVLTLFLTTAVRLVYATRADLMRTADRVTR